MATRKNHKVRKTHKKRKANHRRVSHRRRKTIKGGFTLNPFKAFRNWRDTRKAKAEAKKIQLAYDNQPDADGVLAEVDNEQRQKDLAYRQEALQLEAQSPEVYQDADDAVYTEPTPVKKPSMMDKVKSMFTSKKSNKVKPIETKQEKEVDHFCLNIILPIQEIILYQNDQQNTARVQFGF